MKFLMTALAVLMLAVGSAEAQTFQFQSGGLFTGAPANIRLDAPDVSGGIQAFGLHLDTTTGNYVGTGHVVVQSAGVSIDDENAQIIVIPGAGGGCPADLRVNYIDGLVASGNTGGPWALASSFARFDPFGLCPVEVLQFAGAFGSSRVRSLNLNQPVNGVSFKTDVKLAYRHAVREMSLGRLKSIFR